MSVGAVFGVELVELMLGKIADLELLRARELSGHRRQPTGDQFHQRRLAVAVGAEQRDAIVVVDAQRQPPQHRPARLVADRHVVERDDRRRQGLRRRRNHDRPHLLGDQSGDRLELGEELDARLRLPRLGGLGAEPLDEGGESFALGLLFLGELEV